MRPLPSAFDPDSSPTAAPRLAERKAGHEAALASVREALDEAANARSEKAIARHREQNKRTAKERIDLLLDPGAPFLEIGALAARGMYDGGVHKAGSIGGVGVIEGRTCVIQANDAMVKGGTIYPMGVKKTLRLQAIAMENRLPFVSLVDSGGAYLPLQSEVFPDIDDGGRIFYNQARMSKMGIPQLCAVMGLCTAGAAYIPAMSDEVVHVRGTGAIFLAGPPLVRAATGEDVTTEELGGAVLHTHVSGVSDYLAENDDDAIDILRRRVACLPQQGAPPARAPRAPRYDPHELYSIVPTEPHVPYDIREVIARIVDGSEFEEFQANYGPTMVCGWAYIHGYLVGVLANNGPIFSESALKATHFIELCEKRGTPLVFLQNVAGFIVGKAYERGGITKHGQQMVAAVATCTVPKFTVIVGGSFGAGNYAMCGRAYSPRFLWMWPTAQIAVMGGEQAGRVLIDVQNTQRARAGLGPISPEEEAMILEPVRANTRAEGNALHATANLWDDGIIEPHRTRDVLGLSLAAALHAPLPDPPHGWPQGFSTFRF